MDIITLHKTVNDMFAEHQYDEIEPFLREYEGIAENDNMLVTTFYMCWIYNQEKAAGEETLFSKVSTMEELVARHTRLKFLLRRLDYGVSDDGADSLYRFLVQFHVSSYELLTTVEYCIIHKDKVWEAIKGHE